MADGNAQILRQLGPQWLECRDEQGIFYFNQVTQQSSDTIPAELMGGQPVAQPRPQQSYTPPVQVSSYQPPQVYAHPGHATPPPPHAAQMYSQGSYQPPPQQQQQPHYAQPQQPQNAYADQCARQYAAYQQQQLQPQQQSQAQLMQQMAAQQQQQQMRPMQMAPQSQMQVQQMPQPQQQPAVQKMQFGDWAVYEDELGKFYMHVPSGQQFEAPPPELMQAYQQYRAEQDQQHFDQLRQIETQKQQIDQRLANQTQALQGRYNVMGGA